MSWLEIIKYISGFEGKEAGNLSRVEPSILGSGYTNLMNVCGGRVLNFYSNSVYLMT